MCKGNSFDTFSDLNEAVIKYQNENFVNLVVKNSKTIEAAKRRYPNREFKDSVVYQEINFSCVRAGKYRPGTTTGARPRTNTAKCGCEFVIKVRASKDGQQLLITDTVLAHNHGISEELYQHHSSQRKLDKGEAEMVKRMIALKADKKLIKAHLEATTGKVIIMKDIHNIGTKTVASSVDESELQQIKKALEIEFPDCILSVKYSTDNEVQGIFIQDSKMRSDYDKFPEVLLADGTYKVNDIHMPLYSFVVIDGNMDTQTACFFLLVKEDESSLRDIITVFKKHNPAYVKTGIIITDKDLTERHVFRDEFPDAKLQICLFHVLRTFGREITTTKANITPADRQEILQMIEKIVYSRTSEEYDRLYASFMDRCTCNSVKSYYNQQWHTIREEWVEAFKIQSLNFGTSTNNRIESFFGKIKHVVDHRTSLKDFILKALGVVKMRRMERRHKVVVSDLKRSVKKYTIDPDLMAYIALLMQIAWTIVRGEFAKMHDPTNSTYTTTEQTCTCTLFRTKHLPCRHILALNQNRGNSLFVRDAVLDRWTKAHNDRHQDFVTIVEHSQGRKPKKDSLLDYNGKFKKAMSTMHLIATNMSMFGEQTYNRTLQQMDDILALLQQDKMFVVAEIVS